MLEQIWAQNSASARWPQPDSLHPPLHVFQTWLRQLLWELSSLLAKVLGPTLFLLFVLKCWQARPRVMLASFLLVFTLCLFFLSAIVVRLEMVSTRLCLNAPGAFDNKAVSVSPS